MKYALTLIAVLMFTTGSAHASGTQPEIDAHGCAETAGRFLIDDYKKKKGLPSSARVETSSIDQFDASDLNSEIYFEIFLRVNGNFVKQKFGVTVTSACELVKIVEVSCGHGC